MAPSGSSAWTPAPGRHQLNIGSSLGRALRAKKGGAPGPAKRNVLPEREFYSIRYNFKPSLIDTTKPGSLQVKRGNGNDGSNRAVTVEHASAQPGEVYVFPGSEGTAKEWVYVLIYDEETGGYTLEKLESSMSLNTPEKRAGTTLSPAQSNSPADSAPSSSHAHTVDADLEEILPSSLSSSSKKPEPMIVDDDEEEVPLKMQVPSTPRSKDSLPQKSRAQQQQQQPERPRTSTSSAPPPPAPVSAKASTSKAKPSTSAAPKPKKTGKRATPTFSDAEEETWELPRPAKRAQVPVPVPVPAPVPERKRAPPSPARLELPGMSDSVVPPLPPVPGVPKASSSSMSMPPSTTTSRAPSTAPTPLAALSPLPPSAANSDSEDEWDEVAAPGSSLPHPHPPPPLPVISASVIPAPIAPIAPMTSVGPMEMVEDEGGEEMEIDMNEFETLINEHLEEDDEQEQDRDSTGLFTEDDFLAAAIPEESTPVLPKGPPISLKQLVGGGDSADEDDYSSSEESDDD